MRWARIWTPFLEISTFYYRYPSYSNPKFWNQRKGFILFFLQKLTNAGMKFSLTKWYSFEGTHLGEYIGDILIQFRCIFLDRN
jgi:hypothetical protein